MGERVKDYNFSDDLYYRMLCIRGDSLNGNKEEDRNIMMELADKGLECNSSNRALMDYKAWLLVKAEKYDEALKMYKELAENPRHPASVDSQIGFIYYQDLKHHCRDSLQWYLKSLEKNGDYSGHFYAGMCHMYLNELEEAEKHFLILQSHEPDTLDSYFRLSYVYAMRNELDKALENINRTIEIVKDRKNERNWLRKPLGITQKGSIKMKRLMNQEDKIIIINRPDEDKNSDEPVVFYDLDGKLKLDLSGIGNITADKHSTGGVGDKTSLIVGPAAAACGIAVPKMSGRGLGHTGGTIDKLESIKGYRTELSQKEFFNIVKQTGFSIISQSGSLCPADKKIYALRNSSCTVDSIPLICSSIMSKKLALNADCILLDVKCGSGAFMKTQEDAEKLAALMEKVGTAAGKKCRALVTDMDSPLGNNIGNALEVKEAVEILMTRNLREE